MSRSGEVFAAVYRAVRRVPPGSVTTYGDVSRALFGHARAARTVGWALHALPEDELASVPWWRVISARGVVSTSCETHAAAEQRARLEAEGVRFDGDRVDLDVYACDVEALSPTARPSAARTDRRGGRTAAPRRPGTRRPPG